jgi:hypothetical protein
LLNILRLIQNGEGFTAEYGAIDEVFDPEEESMSVEVDELTHVVRHANIGGAIEPTSQIGAWEIEGMHKPLSLFTDVKLEIGHGFVPDVILDECFAAIGKSYPWRPAPIFH